MTYEKLSDLPDSVRNNLPKHAQEIYQAAFDRIMMLLRLTASHFCSTGR